MPEGQIGRRTGVTGNIHPLNEAGRGISPLALTENGFAVLSGTAYETRRGLLLRAFRRVPQGGFLAPAKTIRVAVPQSGRSGTHALAEALRNPSGSDIPVYEVVPPREGAWVERIALVALVAAVYFSAVAFTHGFGAVAGTLYASGFYGGPLTGKMGQNIRSAGWDEFEKHYRRKPDTTDKTRDFFKAMKGE